MVSMRSLGLFSAIFCTLVLCCFSFRTTGAKLFPKLPFVRSGIIHAKPDVEIAGEALNGMILVERLGDPEFTDSGLFRTRSRQSQRRFLARVAALPAEGFTNENGFRNTVETLCPYKVGDLVYVDNYNALTSEFRGPGIKGKLYSYHRPWYIKAVVREPDSISHEPSQQ